MAMVDVAMKMGFADQSHLTRRFPHVVSKAAPINASEKEELSHVGLRVTKPVQRLVKMQEKINENASGFIQDFDRVVSDTFGRGTGW